MIFFFYCSGQSGSWSVGPLIALVPLLLQLAPYLLQEASSTGFWRQLAFSDDALWLVAGLVLFSLAASFFARWIHRNGGWRFLLQLLLQGYQGGRAARPGGGVHGHGGPGRAQRNGRPPARASATVEQITEALMKLPTEPYMAPEQLAALPVHDLKELIRGRGLEPVKCLEKAELVKQLMEHGGSSAHSCSICCEDYACTGSGSCADGDTDEPPLVLRVLRCGHRFHVECVDRWFLSATDYTRAPACPLCNAPLLSEPKQ